MLHVSWLILKGEKDIEKLIIKVKSKKYYEEIKFENKKIECNFISFKLYFIMYIWLFDYPIKSRNIECVYLNLSFLKLRLGIKGSIIS